MKKLNQFGFIFYVMMATMAINCTDQKDTIKIIPCTTSYERVQSLKDVTGIIGYNDISNEYYINIYVEGTIDEIMTVYPCVLSDKFKKADIKVKLDGELFKDDDLPQPTVGGQKIFRIDIKAISLLN